MENRYFPYPKKNWKQDAFANYLTKTEMDIDLSEYDFDNEKSVEALIQLIKQTAEALMEKSLESVTEDLTMPKKPLLVPVRLFSKHTCFIGGFRYEFLPNREYLVPPEVRGVLIDARIVST